MAEEKKFSDLEKATGSADEDETALVAGKEAIEMLLPAKKAGAAKPKSAANEFYGLSKEELEKFANDPFWVKVRWILFAIFLAAWIAMLVAAIVIVVLAPKCPPRPNLQWWQKDVAYGVPVPLFKDSNDDKVGDLKGIGASLEYFLKLGAKTLLLSPIYQGSKLKDIDTKYGTVDDFQTLVKQMHKKGMHAVLEVRYDDIRDSASQSPTPEALDFWLSKGADGFYITSNTVPFADDDVKIWKDKLDEVTTKTDQPRALILALTRGNTATKGVNSTADLLVDRGLTKYNTQCFGSCVQDIIGGIKGMTANDQGWPSFVIGDGHVSRAASRAGDYLELLVTAQLTLKGTPIIYYGDEVGMQATGNQTLQWTSSLDTWNASNPQAFSSNVQTQTATGFAQSLFKLYQDLTKLRTKESLQWGTTILGNCTGLVAYTRAAEGFGSYLVALNMGSGTGLKSSPPFVGNLASCTGNTQTAGTVAALVLTPGALVNEDLAVKKTIDVGNIYLPSGAGLVIALA